MRFVTRFWNMMLGIVRYPGLQTGQPGSGRLTNRVVNADTSMQVSAVWACVRLLAETVAGLPFKFYKKNPDGTRAEYTDHPLYRLLNNKPNRYQTRIEFWETIVMQLALHGNAYVKIDRRNPADPASEIISLMPLMSMQVWVDLSIPGVITYQYTSGNDVAVYSQKTVWHIKLMGNGVMGLSPMDYARNSIGVALAAEDRVNVMANNGFKPTGVLMIDKVLSPEQRAAIRKNFADLAEGGEDSLRILEANMNYQQVSMNPKDVQLLETRRYQLEDICRFFGVPSVLVNDTKGSTVWGSGVAQIVQGFYKLTVRPYLERIENSMEQWLLAPEDRLLYEGEFDFSALLRGDAAARFTVYQGAVLHGLKTVNECRKEEGEPPIEGGDVAYMQGQMIPLSQLGQQTQRL